MRHNGARHLLSMADLDRDDIEQILNLTGSFAEVGERSIPKVPALRGKTIAWVFYEDSTRTRLSFETAAKRLSADTMNFSVSSSSVNKGESLRDTIETITAMGIDGVVVRHRAAGAPHQVAQWTDASVINAGDGWHQHPTQALLDLYSATRHLGELDGKHVAIVGDINHSRVARSNAIGFAAMGAQVTLVGPPTLLPPSLDGWPVEVTHDLDAVIDDLDICYLLRMQLERQKQAVVPTLREYHHEYGLTSARADRLGAEALIMHPGPMNRGSRSRARSPTDPTRSSPSRSPTACRCAWRCCSCCWAPASSRSTSPQSAVDWRWRDGFDRDHQRHPGRRRRPAADLLIQNGVIAEVGEKLDGDTIIDADGLVVTPGFVDLQVHFREPGGEEAETIQTGSRGAALGGFTAVVVMPNTTPTIDSAAVVRQIHDLSIDALCEVVPSAAITVDRDGEALAPMAELVRSGVRMFTDDGVGVQDAA